MEIAFPERALAEYVYNMPLFNIRQTCYVLHLRIEVYFFKLN